MTKSILTSVALCMAFTANVLAQAPTNPSTPGDPTIPGLVKVADEIKLPAQEAGVLVQLTVQEGVPVKKNQQIGKIDEREVRVQREAAEAAYNGAYQRWNDDIEIRFAKKQADVAKADYDQMVEANRQSAKSITETELRGKKLEWDKSILAIEKSGHDRDIARWEAMSKKSEVDVASVKLQKSGVIAPFDGVVEDIKRHQDEWVQPGDTILTLLKMDVMHVEGAIEQNKYDPYEIAGCNVTVDVEMARGRKISVPGRIIKVSSLVRSDGVFNVRAEIPNQIDNGHWLLRDGLPATMTIHLGTGTGANAAPGVSRAR